MNDQQFLALLTAVLIGSGPASDHDIEVSLANARRIVMLIRKQFSQ
jgi:hypothetical protein